MSADRRVPRYQWVADALLARIASGEFPAGSRLPTEPELTAQYAVSSTTARAAVRALAAAGVVETRHGAGTFVIERRLLTINATQTEDLDRRKGIVAQDSWTTDVKEAGRDPKQRFDLKRVMATDEQAKLFEVEPGAVLVVRQCWRTVDGVPASIETAFYPGWLVAAVPRLDFPDDIQQGTTSYLAERGHPMELHLDYTSARPFSRAEEDFFKAPTGVQALVRERVSYDRPGGRVLRIMETVYRNDMHRVLHVVAGRGNTRHA